MFEKLVSGAVCVTDSLASLLFPETYCCSLRVVLSLERRGQLCVELRERDVVFRSSVKCAWQSLSTEKGTDRNGEKQKRERLNLTSSCLRVQLAGPKPRSVDPSSK